MDGIFEGDCVEVMRRIEDNSIDAVVTDPPYGLKFMGKKWDCEVPGVEVWKECLRVLKPGGHLLAFAGTRTQHRMASAIEDAGFEIRDMIAWVYGSGFPKSHDVSKAIDKAAGAEREVVGFNENLKGRTRPKGNSVRFDGLASNGDITAPATDAARQWSGWGTALKPALEPITVARKPLVGTVAENVLRHGTGGLNIDGCRVAGSEDTSRPQGKDIRCGNWSGDGGRSGLVTGGGVCRWPANLIHDGEAAADLLADAARFFYCAKASKAERNAGCDELEKKICGGMPGTADQSLLTGSGNIRNNIAKNNHPTVKPIELMRYLVRLVCPPGGIVLDPFAGSGTTGIACVEEYVRFCLIERDSNYIKIATSRIADAIIKKFQSGGQHEINS